MKVHLLIFVALLIIVGGLCYYLYKQFFDDGAYFNPNTITFSSDKVGRLSATGEDLRVYEFTPRTNMKKQCVFVAGTNKAAMDCWDK